MCSDPDGFPNQLYVSYVLLSADILVTSLEKLIDYSSQDSVFGPFVHVPHNIFLLTISLSPKVHTGNILSSLTLCEFG